MLEFAQSYPTHDTMLHSLANHAIHVHIYIQREREREIIIPLVGMYTLWKELEKNRPFYLWFSLHSTKTLGEKLPIFQKRRKGGAILN